MRDGRKKEKRDHKRPNHLKGSIFTNFIAYTLLVRLKGSLHFYILLVWMRNGTPLTKWNLTIWGFPSGSAIKESACNAGDACLIPGLGRSHGRGHGNPLQHSSLENPHGQQGLVGYIHGVAKSWTQLSNERSTAHLHQPPQPTSHQMPPTCHPATSDYHQGQLLFPPTGIPTFQKFAL